MFWVICCIRTCIRILGRGWQDISFISKNPDHFGSKWHNGWYKLCFQLCGYIRPPRQSSERFRSETKTIHWKEQFLTSVLPAGCFLMHLFWLRPPEEQLAETLKRRCRFWCHQSSGLESSRSWSVYGFRRFLQHEWGLLHLAALTQVSANPDCQ